MSRYVKVKVKSRVEEKKKSKGGGEKKKSKGKKEGHENCHSLYSGWWLLYFTRALRLNTREKRMQFMMDMVDDAEYFPCATCRPHFIQKMRDMDMSKIEARHHLMTDIETGERFHLGVFRFLFDFKNEINERVGNDIATYEEVLDYYLKLYRESCSGSGPVCTG